MRNRKWTESEIDTLKKGYFTLGARRLERRLNIPATSIRRKAKQLGLRKNTQLTAKSPFTPRMDETLKVMYRQWCTHEEIANKLNLSIQQVYRRIQGLKLTRPELTNFGKHWTEKEIAFLRDSYGRLSENEIAAELCRPLGGIGKKAEQLGLAGKKPRWTNDDIRFLLDNYATETIEAIAMHLKRTPTAIIKKAKELYPPLGLKFQFEQDEKDAHSIPF